MRKDRFVRWCGAGLQVGLVVLWVGHAVAGDGGGGVQAVLEVALTEVDRSEGAQAFIASDDTGGELLVLDSTGSTVRRLTDSLEWWGRPLVLRDSGGAAAMLQGFQWSGRCWSFSAPRRRVGSASLTGSTRRPARSSGSL